MAEPKQYCGNGKSFGEWGGIKVGLEADKLPSPNDRGYINVIVTPKRDKPGEFSVYVDTFNPQQR